MLRVDYDDIEFMHPDAGGGSVYYYNGKPFTGILVEYEGGKLIAEVTVILSHTAGRVASYYTNGQIEEEYFESYNRMYGMYRRWDENGNLLAEKDYGDEYRPYGHENVLAIDVHYRENIAKAVGVLFHWHNEKPEQIITEYVRDVADYIPGEFYKRELPCIMKLLEKIDLSKVSAIIIDGYVFTDNARTSGLGGKLFAELEAAIPVIGVAKTLFSGNSKTVVEIIRGESINPLYVSAIGYYLETAAMNVAMMKGKHRMPVILQELDRLTKEE